VRNVFVAGLSEDSIEGKRRHVYWRMYGRTRGRRKDGLKGETDTRADATWGQRTGKRPTLTNLDRTLTGEVSEKGKGKKQQGGEAI